MLVEKYNNMHKENSNPKLDKYFQTKTLQSLQGKGLFCGMDYVGIKSLVPIEYYSRLDHSKNVAYTASKLTDELSIMLAGAFHDVGTMSFSHVNSFKKGEERTQDNDEKDMKSILLKDQELMTYLKEDKINIEDVICPEKYPLIDKEIPCLCLDRAEGGILATCLFWAHTHDFEQVEELYNMLSYAENLNGMCVDIFSPRFQDFKGELYISEGGNVDYEDFFAAINIYSRKLLSKESRYMMKVLGLALSYYEDMGIIDEESLFHLSESEIIDRILDSKYKEIWLDVTSFDQVSYAKSLDEELSLISIPKIRQANPLCWGQMTLCEIDGISGDFYRELNDLEESIDSLDKPIKGNLSQYTAKVLSKYKK